MRDQVKCTLLLTFFVNIVVMFGSLASAQVQEVNPCEDNFIAVNEFRIQTMQSRYGDKECYIRLTNRNNSNSKDSNSLVWDSKGQLSIIYIFGLKMQSNSKATGAKNFYFLPQTQNLKLNLVGSNIISVTTVNGVEMRFDTVSGQFESISGVEFFQNTNFSQKSPDWLQISAAQNYVFESEYVGGNNPKDNKHGRVRALMAGYQCDISNEHIFSYASKEASLKIKSDAELDTLLKQHCAPNSF